MAPNTEPSGEGLANDATALILYRFAVAAVSVGSFSFTHAVGMFVAIIAGDVLRSEGEALVARPIVGFSPRSSFQPKSSKGSIDNAGESRHKQLMSRSFVSGRNISATTKLIPATAIGYQRPE